MKLTTVMRHPLTSRIAACAAMASAFLIVLVACADWSNAQQTPPPARGAAAQLPDGHPALPAPAVGATSVPGAKYVGSRSCATCHKDQFDRWSKTRMANVVTDPSVNPGVVVADFKTPNPLVNFTVEDVAFVYGTGWKQRYFHKQGKTYVPYPAQWDITNKKWMPYHVAAKTDWWAELYPDPKGDNSGRPTDALCDGCHSVNFDIKTQTPTEWNVGCETCHGAGSVHVARPARDNILNPAHMNYVQASDTCIACHSQGQPRANPIEGKYYDWPVGFHVGLKLADFWKLEPYKLGEQSFTHFQDGTAHKNRMQGNDFVQSVMYTRGVTCFSCHDAHGTDNPNLLRKPVAQVCQTCHTPGGPNGPRTISIEAHTHHKADSPGSQCVACHMPKIEQTIANVNVASHTFRFITPAQTDSQKIPNPCTTCHTDKTTSWATAALKSWTERSPWRVEN